MLDMQTLTYLGGGPTTVPPLRQNPEYTTACKDCNLPNLFKLELLLLHLKYNYQP